jgi:hypothetical protein
MAYDVTGILGGATRSVLEYGTGRLGDVAFSADGSGAPTNWTWDGATSSWRYTDGAALLEYRHVTVADGVGLRLAGCPLAVSGTLTLGDGAYLSAAGLPASLGTGGATVTRVSSAWLGGGTAGASGTAGGNNGANSTAIAAGAFGGRGGNGGTVSASPTPRTGGVAGAITAWDQSVGPVLQALCWHPFQGRGSVSPAGGSGGGSGGSSGSGTSPGGGGGGGVLIVMARRISYYPSDSFDSGPPTVALAPHLRAGGGLGSSEPSIGYTTQMGGGGGGGAGGVVLLVDTLSPVDGAAVLRISANGGFGGAAAATGSGSVATSGGSGGSGGQIWVGYCSGPAPAVEVYGGNGGGGVLGGADGAAGSAGSTVVQSLAGR